MIPDVALVNNTSQRLPCAIVLDGSGSMQGAAIDELNAGLRVLEEELKKDQTARQRVQLLLIRLGGDDEIETITPWTDAIDFTAPEIEANGRTQLGKAVRQALTEIQQQKRNFDDHGIASNRPWLFIFTDGGATDADWQSAAEDCCRAEAAGKVVVFSIAIGPEANIEQLTAFSQKRPPVRLSGLKFREFFVWLSRSSTVASQAHPGDTVQMPSPEAWVVPV